MEYEEEFGPTKRPDKEWAPTKLDSRRLPTVLWIGIIVFFFIICSGILYNLAGSIPWG